MKNRWLYLFVLGLNCLTQCYTPLLSGNLNEDCCFNNNGSWFFQKELLLWKTYEDGLSYTTKKTDILKTDNFTKRSLVNPSFHWEYGFRFLGGYTPYCSPWEFSLSWACIHSKATGHRHHHSQSPHFQGIFPVWSFSKNTLKGDYASNVDFNWHLNTNIIDIEATYKLCPWKNITFTPLACLECALLNQRVHAKYSGGTFLKGIDHNSCKNRFYGIGPRLGSGMEYHVFKRFSFKGLAALTPMYGHFKIKSHENYQKKLQYHHSHTENKFVLAYDYRIGFQWEGKTLDCWPDVLLALYWESHTFLSQNRMPRGDHHFFAKHRDLTLEGWTATATFCF